MQKISYAGCPDLFPAISAQFTVKMCVTTRNREKLTKNPHFGNLRSFKVIDVDTLKKLVTSVCYDKVGCLCLSDTVFMLDEPVSVKWPLFRKVPLFDAGVRKPP